VSVVPDLDQLERAISADSALERLAQASDLAGRLRARGDELLDRFVYAARASGSSWSEIGACFGTSKQAAQQRFAPRAAPLPFGPSECSASVLTAAATEARALGHHYVRPEHLMLGLLAQPEEMAARALAELGVTAELARQRVQARLGVSEPRPSGSLGASPQTKQLLEFAHTIANSLGHRRGPRTEHILLAAVSSRLHSPAATLLRECGASPDRVRDEISRGIMREAPELAMQIRSL
jgi:hypothetical protein